MSTTTTPPQASTPQTSTGATSVPLSPSVLNMAPITSQAINHILKLRKKNSGLRPDMHKSALLQDADTRRLGEILSQSEITDLIKERKTTSEKAGNAKDKYKNHAITVIKYGSLAALAAGLALHNKLEPDDFPFGTLLSFLQFVFVFIAFIATIRIVFTKPHRTWTMERKQSEFMRLKIARAVLAQAPSSGASGNADASGTGMTAPLQLEYVQEFLARNQGNWFKKEIRSFSGEIKSRKWIRGFAIGILGAAALVLFAGFFASIITGPAAGLVELYYPPLGVWVNDYLSYIQGASKYAAIATIFIGVVQAMLIAMTGVTLAEGNTERYSAVKRELDEIDVKLLPAARTAALTAPSDKPLLEVPAIDAWWAALHDTLASEAKCWEAVVIEQARRNSSEVADIEME